MPRHSVRNSISKPFLPLKRALSLPKQERGISSDSIHVQLARALLDGTAAALDVEEEIHHKPSQDHAVGQLSSQYEPREALRDASVDHHTMMHNRRKSTGGIRSSTHRQAAGTTKDSSPPKSGRRASLSIVDTSTSPAPIRRPSSVAPGALPANAPISSPSAPASSSSPAPSEGTRSFSLNERATSASAQKTSSLPVPSSMTATKTQRPDSAARSRQISLPQVLHVPPGHSHVPAADQVHNAKSPTPSRPRTAKDANGRPGASAPTQAEKRSRQPLKRFSFPASTPIPSSQPTSVMRDAGSTTAVAKGSLSPVLEGKEADLVIGGLGMGTAEEEEEEEPWQYIKCRPRGPDGRFIRYVGDDDGGVQTADSRNEGISVHSSTRPPQQSQRKRTPSLPAHHALHLFSSSRLRSESSNARSSNPSTTTKLKAFAGSKHIDMSLPPKTEGSRSRSVSANDAIPSQSKLLRRWRKSLLRPPASSIHPASAQATKRQHVASDSLPRSPTAGLQAWSQALQSDLDDSFVTSGGIVYDWSSRSADLSQHGSESFEDDSGIGSFSVSLSSSSEEQEEGEVEGEEEYDDQGGLLPPRYLLPYISRSGSSSWQIDSSSSSREGATLKVSTSRQSHLRRVSCPEILLTPSGSSLLGPSTLFSPSEQTLPAVPPPASSTAKATTSTPPYVRKRKFVHDLPKASLTTVASQRTASSPAKLMYRQQLSPAPEALFGPLMRRPSTSVTVAAESIDEDATIRPTRPRTVKRVSFSSPTRPSRSTPTGGSPSYVFPVSEEGFGARTMLELLPRDLNTDLEVRPWMVVAPRFVLDDCGVGVRDWDRDRQESGDSL